MIARSTCPPLLCRSKPEQPDRGDHHVTQTLACDRCRSFAQRRQSGTYPGFCLARRLARWMGLGRRCDGVPVGVADGAQVGARHGGPAGVLVGDGVARVGVGADRAMSWRLDFTAEVVSFAVLSRARGVRAGSWSIVAGDRRAPDSRATNLTSAEPPAYGIGRRTSEAIAGISAIRSAQLMA